ncbi:OprO/OprP family phosphate-selective porin [Aureimonas leprariae]|nr:porin [Aureimonas leprariae]
MRSIASALPLGVAAVLVASAALAQQPVISGATPLKPSVEKNPLRFGTDEAYVSIAPFFQFEPGHISSSPNEILDNVDDTDAWFRRARLYIDFGLYDFGGRYAADFGGDSGPDTIYAYLDWNFNKNGTIQVGQQENQFSMQSLIGSRSALFNENGTNATLQPQAAVGAALFYGQENYSLGAGVFGADINDEQPLGEGTTVSARATYAPLYGPDASIHLGAALSASFDTGIPRSFSGSNGTALFEVSPITTGAYNDVDDYLAANLEFGAAVGRFTVQSEYTFGEVEDGQRDEAFLHGGYLGILAFLTEDHRDYDGKYGIFKRVKPKDPITKGGGFGALEIGGRLDYLDLSEASDAAADASGRQIGGTGIVNWYLNDKLRLSASDTYTAVVDGPNDGDEINTAIFRVWFVY